MKLFCEEIKELMKKKHLSSKDVSIKLGKPHHQVKDWISGKNEPKYNTGKSILNSL